MSIKSENRDFVMLRAKHLAVFLSGGSLGQEPVQECWYFKNRTCYFGDRCRFLHRNEEEKEEKEEVQECRHFAKGTCNRGDKCRFFHNYAAFECRHHANGFCKKGTECKWKHTVLKTRTSSETGNSQNMFSVLSNSDSDSDSDSDSTE